MAAHDNTQYEAGAMPEVTLRQIWHAASIEGHMRLRLASIGITSVDLFANIAANTRVMRSPDTDLVFVNAGPGGGLCPVPGF